jgi:hypothetical protein
MVRGHINYKPAYDAHLGFGPGVLGICKGQIVNWLSEFQIGDVRPPGGPQPDLDYLVNGADILGDDGLVMGRKARLLHEKRVRLMPSNNEIVFPVNSIVSVYFDDAGVASSVRFDTDQQGQPILAPAPPAPAPPAPQAPPPPAPPAPQMGGRRRRSRRITRRRVTRRR